MARIRTIKPEFFTSEDIVSLSPLARLLYIALWCEADREGRMAWKPRTFKLRYFPSDDCDIDGLCAEIVGRGMVKLYGDGLAYIPAFSDHQHVNPRESASTLPDPDASPRVRTRHSRDSDAQVGKEGKGKEGKGTLVAMPEDWQMPPDWITEASAKKPGVDWVSEAARFTSHHRSKGSKFLDWKQAWWTWVNSPYTKSAPTTVLDPNRPRRML